MKTIFISIPWFLPAFKAGGPIQSIANMVKELDAGYQFYIYTSNTDLHSLPIAVALTNQWVYYNDYTKVWYATKKDRSQNLVEQVKLVKPQSLYIVGLFDWHFNIVPILFADCAHKIVSVRGMLHAGALEQKAVKKKMFLRGMKWLGLEKKYTFHATDAKEAAYIKATVGGEAVVFVAGNFARLFSVQSIPLKASGSLALVSVGIISPMKNYLLVLEALKEVKSNVQYDIYGPVKEVAYWEACLQVIATLPGNITVAYHPELPAQQVSAKLQGKHVFILPSKSENYGHAMVEALSAGLPVVTSTGVPWVGLAVARAGLNVNIELRSTNVEVRMPVRRGGGDREAVVDSAELLGSDELGIMKEELAGSGESAERNLVEAIEMFAAMGQEEWEGYSKGAVKYIHARIDVGELKREYGEMFGGLVD